MKSLLIKLFLLLSLGYSAAVQAQLVPDCPPCPNDTCPGYFGVLHWPFVWCQDDTATLYVTWPANVVPMQINWHVIDTLNHDGIIVGTNFDSCYVLGMAQYCVDITDTSGCNFCVGGIWPGLLPYTPTIDTLVVPSYCNEATGSIFTTITNMFQGETYTYMWSNGNNTEGTYGLEGGNYMLTVTVMNINDFLCPAVFSIDVPYVNDLDIMSELTMDSSCTSGNGLIDLTLFPPSIPYSYNWSTGSVMQDLLNAEPGTYSVTVTGPSPCSAVGTYEIFDQSTPIDGLTYTVSPAFCDLATGSIDLTVHGGLSPFSYLWSNGYNEEDPIELIAGDYEVTVTGFGDCAGVIMVTVPDIDSLLTLSAMVTPNTSCLSPDGEIILSPNPDGSYAYDWLTGQTTQDIINIPGGNYAVTMTAGNCQVTGNYIVPNQVLLPHLAFTTTPSSCGMPNGSIDLSVTNGVTPYTYAWSDGNSTQDLSSLHAETYIVTVTGGNGCTIIDSVTIGSAGTFTISSQVGSNTSCTTPNGLIQITVMPAGMYSYVWSNGSSSEDLGALAAGTYTITITQDTTCTLTETFVIVDQLPSIDTTISHSMSCVAADTGTFISHLVNLLDCDSVVIEHVGWLPSDTLSFSGTTCDPVLAGTFTQHLINQFGCDSLIISTVTLLVSDTTSFFETTCDSSLAGITTQHFINQNGCDSLAQMTIAFVPVDSTNLQLSTCDTLESGIFIENLSNQFGCDSVVVKTITYEKSEETFLLEETCDPVQVGLVSTLYHNQAGCDSIVHKITTLALSDTTLLTNETCHPDLVGSSIETVQNQSGCDSVIITNTVLFPLPALQLTVNSDFHGYAISCSGESDGTVSALGIGSDPFSYVWSNGVMEPNVSGLVAGLYEVTVTDGNGCTKYESILLAEPPPFSISFQVSSPDCFDQHNGIITIQEVGGIAPVQYSIDGINFQSSPSFEHLAGGTYHAVAVDAQDCLKEEVVLVNAPLSVSIELGDDQEIQSGDTAIIQAIVNVPFDSLMNITWTGLTNPPCPACLVQAVVPFITTTYSVLVTTSDGCYDEDAITLVIENSGGLYVPNVFSPNGDAVNDVVLVSAPKEVSILSFEIFDRWGNLVFAKANFTPNDPAYSWDGSSHGKPLNVGVFAYKLLVSFPDGKQKILNGDITLLR